MKERPVMPANELKPCPTMGSKCRGCPDCPGASSTGLKSGDITNEAARKELELWFPQDVGARDVGVGKRDDLFKVGEVWQSPRGTLYKVMAVDGNQATLRLGSFGDGRIVRRWVHQNYGWKLWASAQEKAL